MVEVMVSCVVLMIIAIAGAEYLMRGQATLAIQKNRRTALVAANSRLEDIRATPYTNLTIFAPDFSSHPVQKSGSSWVIGSNETVSINGVSLPITTTLQYCDVQNDNNSYDCLRVKVSVGYRPGLSDRVTVETVKSP